ncbi:MAG TPA: response regulator [Candidatus Moranbacteria bacterium]|nr:response regulator [Candidatus Moranbacteria bacterium]HRY27518.1 response regulator [Candidatus Moranbacteria bacterium]HSA08698.1 response regulator [Candidatus Moranbacteria bacterium]
MTKILIIEDDWVLQKALADYLSTEGFETKTAADGESGIALALAEKPDLILLDIVLPKKDGFEVLRTIRAEEITKKIPVVLLTNLDSISDVEKALELGATTYLVKADYKLEEVTAKVKELLNIK